MMKHELVKKRDEKIEVMTNEWLKFGAHDDANMPYTTLSIVLGTIEKYGISAEGCRHTKGRLNRYTPKKMLNLRTLR